MTFLSERDAMINQEVIEQEMESRDCENEERLERLNRLANRLIQEAREVLSLHFGLFDPSFLNYINDENRPIN